MKKIGIFVAIAVIGMALCGCNLGQNAGKTASASSSATAQLSTVTSVSKDSTATPDQATASPDAETATPKPATPTPKAAATPKPTATAAPAVKSVKVSYQSPTVVIKGLDAAGATQWTRKITVKDETELDPFSEATIEGGIVYLQANYRLVALDGSTGKTVWVSTSLGGLCKPILKYGVVYTSSYYGSPLIGLSAKDGAIAFVAKMKDSSFYWADSLKFVGSTIVVHFAAAGPDQDEGTAVFSLKGKLISKKVGK